MPIFIKIFGNWLKYQIIVNQKWATFRYYHYFKEGIYLIKPIPLIL